MNLCQRCKKECKHDLEKCTYYSPTKMTNFEKIKSMSIEEMTEFIKSVALGTNWLKGNITNWLEQEVQEDE